MRIVWSTDLLNPEFRILTDDNPFPKMIHHHALTTLSDAGLGPYLSVGIGTKYSTLLLSKWIMHDSDFNWIFPYLKKQNIFSHWETFQVGWVTCVIMIQQNISPIGDWEIHYDYDANTHVFISDWRRKFNIIIWIRDN
jgi:hypothetical protein